MSLLSPPMRLFLQFRIAFSASVPWKRPDSGPSSCCQTSPFALVNAGELK